MTLEFIMTYVMGKSPKGQTIHGKVSTVQIILYHDAVEVCNPLGNHAGRHKLDMFYYILGNLNSKVRSKYCAVRLLGIANAKLVKMYGYNPIL